MPCSSLSRFLTGGLLAIGLLSSVSAYAYAPENQLLQVKGYSPTLIDAISTQRNRQEWRQPPAPKRTPLGQAFHNIYINDWTGSFDDFGNRIIREQ